MLNLNRLVENEYKVLASHTWGTIGPKYVEASKALADLVGAAYGIVCHSYDAAYESLLRHFGACCGTSVVVGSVSAPADSLLPICTGAAPLFVATCDCCGMLKISAVEEALSANDNIACVVADYIAGSEYPLDQLYAVCKAKGVGLVLNAGGDINAKYNGKNLAEFADAVFYSLEAGSAICPGKGGFVCMNELSVYEGAYAYHNCGRAFGVGSSLDMDTLVGGDMRVCEWNCVAILEILESGSIGTAAPMKQVKMEGQPVFESAYAKKMIGK